MVYFCEEIQTLNSKCDIMAISCKGKEKESLCSKFKHQKALGMQLTPEEEHSKFENNKEMRLPVTY